MTTSRNLLLFVAGGILAATTYAQTANQIIRFEPSGPGGKGLVGPNARPSSKADWKATSYYYYKSPLNPKMATGVWETDNFHAPLHKVTSTEYIHLLQGTITLADASGKEEVFHAGDDLLIPRGANVEWKKAENVKEYWAIFDVAPADAPAAKDEPAPAVIRLSSNGPAGVGLTDRGKTKSHKYLTGADRSFVGVWEMQPVTGGQFHKTKYTELMVFLSGNVTLTTPSGQKEVFHGGEVALVPRGIEYKWESDTTRKFYAIFDFEPEAAAATGASGAAK